MLVRTEGTCSSGRVNAFSILWECVLALVALRANAFSAGGKHDRLCVQTHFSPHADAFSIGDKCV